LGRLLSGLYTFVDGHIYYNNNVIKIRYDLIESFDSHRYKENEVFDYYFDIFELTAGKVVRSNTPLDSHQNHRFGYIITDRFHKATKKLIILPYLHENRIYLNRLKQRNDYYYTSLESNIEDQIDYNLRLEEIYKLKDSETKSANKNLK